MRVKPANPALQGTRRKRRAPELWRYAPEDRA
jgi:hypothetical protein